MQWLQIYETDTSTLTSVLRAMAPSFSDFALYKADDSNVLIVAVRQGKVPQPTDRVFGIPALRGELARVDVTSLRDLEARFIGNRSLLLPALESAAAPANSDFFPYVDLHAIRARVLHRNALEVTSLATDPTAMLDLLLRRPPPALPAEVRDHAYLAFDRLNREATAVVAAIVGTDLGQLEADDLRLVALLSSPAAQCARPGVERAWLDSVFQIVQSTTPTLDASQLNQLWQVIDSKPCARRLKQDDAAWLHFLRAVAQRQSPQVAALGKGLLDGSFVFESQAQLAYAAQATISSEIAQGNVRIARELLAREAGGMVASGTSKWALDLLAGQAGAVLTEVP